MFVVVVDKGWTEVDVDVVEELWGKVLVTGTWVVVGSSVVVLLYGSVTLVVVVGALVLVISQSTTHGQLQTCNSGSKYNLPERVFGHMNLYAIPKTHT